MKTIIKFLFAFLILFAFSCDQETTLDPQPTDLEAVSAKASKATLDVADELDGSGVDGSGTLHRNKNGITVNVKASGLTPGYAYTLWVIPFNYPGECSDLPVEGCDGSDLFGDAKGDVIYGAGHVVGGSGKGNFSAHLNEGDIGRVTEYGLIDAEGAEVHVVIRCHGPAIPGMISEQIHTFNGGCNPGDANEGECADVWFGIFL